MRCAETNCTTLRAADGATIAFESVRKALDQYESLWIQCGDLAKVRLPYEAFAQTNC